MRRHPIRRHQTRRHLKRQKRDALWERCSDERDRRRQREPETLRRQGNERVTEKGDRQSERQAGAYQRDIISFTDVVNVRRH